MKTAEELNELKQEHAELTDEELKAVAGGKGNDSRIIGNRCFIGHVSQTDGVIGECYYVTEDGGNSWFYGRLTSRYNEKYWFWTYHWNSFYLITDNGAPAGGSRDVRGDAYTMYTKMLPYEIVK